MGETLMLQLTASLCDGEIHVWELDYCRLQGRAPLRRVLAAYLAVFPDDVHFAEGTYGRPCLAGPHGALEFNWSHCGDHALLAVAHGITPGIDLECLRSCPNALGIAKRYFCHEETAALAALPPALCHQAFLSLWTAKEAVLKAMGRGLAYGLDRPRFSVTPSPLRLLALEGEDVAAWQLLRLPVRPFYVASLAWRGGPHRVQQKTLADIP